MDSVAERVAQALADRYRIERELGEGGMATVYLAEDLKHQRQVAIKVLKPELAAVLGAERFVQEITTTAQLQHPHILPLFDSGTADGFLFYVMPYIEGETLRDKLNRETQLGVDEAVRITREVADALDYAHRHGVIHRDIKPENILLHDGRPMVADFGIALAVSAAAGGRMTETGMSLGTPHYMSPEQATADKEITGRSDVYSLASVLYEMLTGDPPHTGSSAQQIIVKIIADEARPVREVRKSVPPNVAAALSKALEKLPADRFESAKAFADALANSGFRHGAEAGKAASGVGEVRRWKRVAAATAALAALAVAALAVSLWPTRSARRALTPPMVMEVPFGEHDSISGTPLDRARNVGRPSRTAFAFSPDGRTLVYTGPGGRLLLRPLDSRTSTAIPGVTDAQSPFFSPDGRFIGYWSAGYLRRVPATGGPSTAIAAIGRITGASWGPHDRIVVGLKTDGLVLLGAARPDTLLGPQAVLPHFLPGGKSLLFTHITHNAPFDSDVEWLPLNGGRPRILVRHGADARFVPTGHLIFVRDGTLMSVPFDRRTHEVTGTPFAVLPDVMESANSGSDDTSTGAMQVAFSPLGQLAWIPGGVDPDSRREVVELDRHGHTTPLPGAGQHFFLSARLSPDGHRLALASIGSHPSLEVYNLRRGTAHTLPTHGLQLWTVWSTDGRRVVTMVGGADSTRLVSLQADGAGEPRDIGRPFAGQVYPAFSSPDGSKVYAMHPSRRRLVALDASDGAPDSVPDLPKSAEYPTPSPDGKWLAYVATEPQSGQRDVFVSPWPTLDRRWKVSAEGGISPAWTRGGRELIYLESSTTADSLGNAEVRVMSVAVSADTSVAPGAAHLLFTSHLSVAQPLRMYDVSRDGSRFFALRRLPMPPASDHLYLMTGWFARLKRLSAEQESGK